MFNPLGYSVYVSNFGKNKKQLSSLYKEGSTIFTSFHVSEEYDDTYVERAAAMCRYLSHIGYRIMVDVSPKTLKLFQVNHLMDFSEKMNIGILRIDYGYSEEEIAGIAKQIPICVNASVLTAKSAEVVAKNGIDVYAMHNFYPRPETGLDEEQFFKRNLMLKQVGIKVLAFIPGDMEKRGPIFEGLPTLEVHRNIPPYTAYIDMMRRYGVDMVFVGDGIISDFQSNLIEYYNSHKIIGLPVVFNEEYKSLYDRIYTIRGDSPRWLMRLQESREYSCFGQEIEPNHCIPRMIGAVTMDNIHYKRYSGEIQIVREPLPEDKRVNVIGMVPKEYRLLLHNISNGDKIRFIK